MIPIILMLTAGAITSIITFLQDYELTKMLWILFLLAVIRIPSGTSPLSSGRKLEDSQYFIKHRTHSGTDGSFHAVGQSGPQYRRTHDLLHD